MPTATAPLDHVLRAVADPVRRDVLDRLRDVPATHRVADRRGHPLPLGVAAT